MSIDYVAEYDNRALVPDHPAIFARWAKDAPAYRDEASRAGCLDRAVIYGASPRQHVDLFKGAAGADAPLTMFIHGGYWRANEPSVFSHVARGLNLRGVTVAMAGYDLCPQVTIADIVSQMQSAGLFLWRRWRRRITVFGHSAGGHLTAALIATDWKTLDRDVPEDLVPAGYSLSGLFDLVPLTQIPINADLRLDVATAKAASPHLWPVKPSRVFDAVVGSLESPEFHRQSRDIEAAWRQAGLETRYEDIAGANHFTILDALSDPGSAMVDRLVELTRRTQNRP